MATVMSLNDVFIVLIGYEHKFATDYMRDICHGKRDWMDSIEYSCRGECCTYWRKPFNKMLGRAWPQNK